MSDTAPPSTPPSTTAPARSRWPKRLAQVVVGLVVGLVIAEGVFRFRDDGAFPHVNFYVDDAVLGVRLEKHASERLAFGGNPTTTIGTNSLGYRTHAGSADGEWPAASDHDKNKGDILVVGDSQVYGLGVEGSETFSAKLAAKTGRTVINGGVPTYGPQEYAAVVDEVLAQRKVERVVFVVNVANDLFELAHPNTERHAVWDGWAVRKETAPTSSTSFPGRQWFMSQSHLVFAARKALRAREDAVQPEHIDPPAPSRASATSATPSEGSWTDLLSDAQKAVAKQAALEAATKVPEGDSRYDRAARDDRRIAEQRKLERLESDVNEAIYTKLGESPGLDEGNEAFIEEAKAFAARQGRPDDIVVSDNAEAGRFVEHTATALLAAAHVKKRQYAALRAKAKASNDAALGKLLDDVVASERAIDDAAAHPLADAVSAPLSPLAQVLLRVKERCDSVGAKLVVVALPVDVMVSADEWKKYDTTARDMSATSVLLQEIVDDAVRIGAIGIDVTVPLQQAEPGAFLDKDLHMTAKGHDVVATAIAARIDALPALPLPRRGYPDGRSAVPDVWEWERVTEVSVKGSTAAGCETKQVREWLKVVCFGGERPPVGVEVVSGGRGEALASFYVDTAVLLAPVVKGQQIVTRFMWKKHTQDLVIDWMSGEAATLQFQPKQPTTTMNTPTTPDASSNTQLLSTCGYGAYCPSTLYGAAEPGCDVYDEWSRDARPPRPDCVRSQPAAPPSCAEGHAPMFATLRCHALCDADRPCSGDDVCVPWQGASACLAKRFTL